MVNISLNALCFCSNPDKMQARKSGLWRRGLNIGSVIYHYTRKTWRQTREDREGREEGGRRVGVVMLGRSPYLHWSDWWGWGIGSVMVQIQQSDRMCLKDGAGEYTLGGWSDSSWRKNSAKQMMLPSWPCNGDTISSLLLILKDSLSEGVFFPCGRFLHSNLSKWSWPHCRMGLGLIAWPFLLRLDPPWQVISWSCSTN